MKVRKLSAKLSRKLRKTYCAFLRKPKAVGTAGSSLEEIRTAYAHRLDLSVRMYYKESESEFKKPYHLSQDATFESLHFTFPERPVAYEAILLEVRNPEFSFQHNHLLDDQRRVIYEPLVRFEELPIQHEYLQAPPRLSGTVAYLANTLQNQYGHWLQTQLPLLAAYWDTFGKDTIDYYYLGEGRMAGFVAESLAKLGIRRSQILNRSCRADRSLIAIKHRPVDLAFSMRTGLEMDGDSFHFLKTNLFQAAHPPQGGAFPKKLFVMRGRVTARRELNLAELRAALEPQGFVFMSMEGKTMQQEADLFGNAEVVMGVHGSALHNTLFCRPGTKVIELFPYDYFDASNYVLCQHGGCDYSYLIGEPLAGRPKPVTLGERNSAHIQVDVAKLLRLCHEKGVAQPLVRRLANA